MSLTHSPKGLMSDRDPKNIFLSVVFPAYNKETRIAASIDATVAYLAGKPFAAEVIVVDDGSRDRTAEAARAALAGKPFVSEVIVDDGSHDRTAEAAGAALAGRVPSRVIRREKNRGKGASVREGVLAASGEVILFSDDDLSTPIGEFDKLLAALQAGADVAIGSRALPESDIRVRQRRPRELMGKTFNLLVRLFVLKGYRDTQCGFKAFRRAAALDLFSRLQTTGFGFDVEVLVLCRELGYRVAEVPVVWSDSRPSRVSLVRGSLGMLGEIRRIRRLVRRSRNG
jgi:dolichyl-phosphate beta-glucosyltransferase